MSFHVIGLPISDRQHAVASPYRMQIACYIRSGDKPHNGLEVLEQWRVRLLAVHVFDADGMPLGSDLVEGRHLEAAVERLLAEPKAQYLRIHYILPGRYAARIERA